VGPMNLWWLLDSFGRRWLQRDLGLPARYEGEQRRGLAPLLLLVDEGDPRETHTCALVLEPPHPVKPLPCLNRRREGLTYDQLHRDPLAPVVETPHGELVLGDQQLVGSLPKMAQSSGLRISVDGDDRCRATQVAPQLRRECLIKEAEDRALGHALRHILDLLLCCG
jgi:hypothetical protein